MVSYLNCSKKPWILMSHLLSFRFIHFLVCPNAGPMNEWQIGQVNWRLWYIVYVAEMRWWLRPVSTSNKIWLLFSLHHVNEAKNRWITNRPSVCNHHRLMAPRFTIHATWLCQCTPLWNLKSRNHLQLCIEFFTLWNIPWNGEQGACCRILNWLFLIGSWLLVERGRFLMLL